jgi:hypothetical protein
MNMDKMETFTATGARKIHAYRQISEFGATYFNPLIGSTAAETCENTEHVMAFLHGLMVKNLGQVEDDSGALLDVVKLAWTAMQYERDVAALERKAA